MTLLIGSSVLLIAASAIALLFGWITSEESLIWTSIIASAAAAIVLTLAFYRSRNEVVGTARAGPSEAAPEVAQTEPTRQLGGSSRPDSPPPNKPATGSPDADVVAVPDRQRFHRPDCRHARAKGAERISRAAARRRGYEACTICKP